MSVVYLDENATARVDSEAAQAATYWLTQDPANASSVHRLGRVARGIVEQSRRDLAQSLSVSPRHLTFTSGATEGLSTLISGLIHPGDHVLVSAVEHPATWGALERSQAEIEIIEVDAHGRIDPLRFAQRCKPQTRLGVMMAAQNELGVLYPTRRVAEALGEIPLLVDAAQAYGKVSLSLEETGATYAVISGHKMGAPLGVGAIWCREGAPFRPLLAGGGQERGRRAGTENVPAIAGWGVAARGVMTRLHQLHETRKLRDSLRTYCAQHPLITCLGLWGDLDEDERLDRLRDPLTSEGQDWSTHHQLPNTLYLHIPSREGDLLLQQLDLKGYCLSSGSACSSGALEPSPTLLALGLAPSAARRGLRVSLGPQTTLEELQGLITCLDELLS